MDDKRKAYLAMKVNSTMFFACGLMNLVSSAIYAKQVYDQWQG